MPNEAMLKPTWPAGSSVEQRFVLAVIGHQSPQREDEWRKLLPEVNWSQLLEVTRPDLYPYLHFCIQTRVGVGLCPQEVMRQLASSRQVTAQNIPIVALKGIVLAFLAYPDPSLRPMNDIDLLLDEKHLDSAVRILRNLGYSCPARLRGLYFEGEGKLQKLCTQLLSEVHTQIECTAPASAVDAGDIWSRSVKTRISDFEVYTLNEEDFLFHLCLHMARRHCYTTGFLPFVDILKWVETHGANWDWPSLIRIARSKKYEAYIELTLDLARDFLSAPIPPSPMSNLPHLAVMKDIAWQQITDDRGVQNFVPPGLVALLNAGSMSAQMGALLNRLRPTRGNFLALRRLLKTLRLGSLSRARLQHQVHLQQQREQLAALLRSQGSRPA